MTTVTQLFMIFSNSQFPQWLDFSDSSSINRYKSLFYEADIPLPSSNPTPPPPPRTQSTFPVLPISPVTTEQNNNVQPTVLQLWCAD